MHPSPSIAAFLLLIAASTADGQHQSGLRRAGPTAVSHHETEQETTNNNMKRHVLADPNDEELMQEPFIFPPTSASPMEEDYVYDENELSSTPSLSPTIWTATSEFQNELAMEHPSPTMLMGDADMRTTSVGTKKKKHSEEKALFQGDIIPDYDLIMNEYGPDTLEELEEAGVPIMSSNSSTSSGIATKNLQVERRWTTRVGDVVQIPYTISSSFNSAARQLIETAMADLVRRSGVVNFVPRTSERDYVTVVTGSGCSSYVGNIRRGAQALTLNVPGCMRQGTIQHEVLHALGFQHEQSRPDRDNFVRINFQNVEAGKEFNFAKETSSNNLGSQYDYGSVMHYNAKAFSKNGQDTISAPQTIGQRSGADNEDIFQIQLLYQCASRARTADEFKSSPCSTDCKCWEGASGSCSGNDNACQGNLVCRSNQCVKSSSGPAPSPGPPPSGAAGTCGNGSRGNGVCASGECCSQYGWCGTSSAHCSGGGPTGPAPSPPSSGGTCGRGNRGNGVCASGECCSQYGWCGTSSAHCSGGGPTGPAPSPPSSGGTCGRGNRGNGVCASGECCSQYGWCGTSSAHCSGGGPAPSPPASGGTCGRGNRGNGVCASGECCSQYGWCGTSSAHCSSRGI